MLRWHEIPAGQELEEPVGLLCGLEPPHHRRRLSKGRDLPPPLLPLTFAACVPTKATTNSRLSRELEAGFFGCRKEKKKLLRLGSEAPVYSYEWKSKPVKPGRLFRLRDGSVSDSTLVHPAKRGLSIRRLQVQICNAQLHLHADNSSPGGPPEPGKSREVPSVSFDKAAVGLPAGVRWWLQTRRLPLWFE